MTELEQNLTLGEAIRKLRTSAGLGQKALAREIGVDPTYISHLEAGRRDPSISSLRSIARTVAVPPGILLAVALWVDLPKEAKDHYESIIRTVIETADAAQVALYDRRSQEDDAK